MSRLVAQQFLPAPPAALGNWPVAAGGYGPVGSMVTLQLVWREKQVAMDWP